MNIDPKILPYLLAGGGSALAGGLMTSMGGRRDGESRSKRRWRILRNALLMGGAGAGAYGLINKGIKDTITEPMPGDDQPPTAKAVHDFATGTGGKVTAAGGAGLGLWGLGAAEEKGNADAILRRSGNAQAGSAIKDPKRDLRGVVKNEFSRGEPKLPAGQTHHPINDIWGQTDEQLRGAGINKPGIQRGLQQDTLKARPGSIAPDKLVSRRAAAKGSAKLWGERLTGWGRTGGMAKRVGVVGTAAALPYLLGKFTEQRHDS